MAKELPIHPSNPELKAVEITPVFPDEELWPNSYLCLVFDRDPAPKLDDASREELEYLKSEAVLKNFGWGGTNFLAYMVPKKRKKEEEVPTQEEFQWVREYSYEIKKGNEFANSYFFTFGSNCVSYRPISTRINLTKLQNKESSVFLQPSSITAIHRELTPEEIQVRQEAKDQLLQPEILAAREIDFDAKEEEIFDDEEEDPEE